MRRHPPSGIYNQIPSRSNPFVPVFFVLFFVLVFFGVWCSLMLTMVATSIIAFVEQQANIRNYIRLCDYYSQCSDPQLGTSAVTCKKSVQRKDSAG